MSITPYLGEIALFPFGFAPKDWAMCNGQLLPINQNQALFSLLGTTYGGDGRVNFGLPDLRGRMIVHVGNGHTLGERGGEEAHTLTLNELPRHNHALNVANAPTQANPAGALVAATGGGQFTKNPASAPMDASAVTSIGGNQPHENRSPYLVLNYCIAIQPGIFPSQN